MNKKIELQIDEIIHKKLLQEHMDKDRFWLDSAKLLIIKNYQKVKTFDELITKIKENSVNLNASVCAIALTLLNEIIKNNERK